MPKKFIMCKGKVLKKKGRVFIMSVKRGVTWPDRREIVEQLGGEKNVLLLNVTSQSLKYRDTFSPMYISNNTHIHIECKKGLNIETETEIHKETVNLFCQKYAINQ